MTQPRRTNTAQQHPDTAPPPPTAPPAPPVLPAGDEDEDEDTDWHIVRGID
ncbi:hypothetical protein [Streptomyces phytophilus]|uniref:hypothetical protein n=1 Tax=Streptomyces phytophilus TaxID=722715 RepID=UPI0015F0B953|nr:hypothetical protein [Streptomyces phytophilus]